MATLKDLLKEEGFKAGRMKSRSRASFKAEVVCMPRHLSSEKSDPSPLGPAKSRTKRTKSDVVRRGVRTEIEESEGKRSSRKNNNVSELFREPKKKVQEIEEYEEGDFGDKPEVEIFNVEAFDNWENRLNYNDKPGEEGISGNYIQNNVRNIDKMGKKHVNDLQVSEIYRENLSNDVQDGGRYGARSADHRLITSGNLQRRLHDSNASSSGSSKNSQQLKMIHNPQKERQKHFESTFAEPALDEVATQAMISILSGHIKRYLKDKKFWAMLYHNCLSCLGLSTWEDENAAENGVIFNLKQAIETIEKVVTEEAWNPKDLKKASLQLSVIAGLNTNDLKDGVTSGIPNSHLAACAHIYLSIIYKLQKKDRVCSKHLLQVFCESPYQARSCLLKDLWDHLFLPHLSHLRVWYDQEAEAIPNTSSRLRKMELLQKVYTEILDSGTYQFAVYYKEWLTDGIETPAVPSIYIPTISVDRFSPSDSCGSSPRLSRINSVSQMPLISRKLFEAVFSQSVKTDDLDEPKDGEGEETFTACMRSLDNISEEIEGNKAIYPQMEQVMQKPTSKNFVEASDHSLQADTSLLPMNDDLGSRLVTLLETKELKVQGDDTLCCQTISTNIVLDQISHAKANELTLKKLAKAVFQLQLNEEAMISTTASYSNTNAEPSPNCDIEKIALSSTVISSEIPGVYTSTGPCGDDGYYEESSFFSSIPKDFICPLTGQLFEDPVTLETGQTFEQIAITKWFSQGNRTCPATGRILEHIAVPVTNLVLKRVIDGWKSEHCKSLLLLANQLADSPLSHKFKSKDESAIMILEKLLTELKTEEGTENAKHLISLGGLEFLIRRFELGELEEKIRVAALLTYCIKADGNCRNYIARSINKSCFIELLHDKQVRSRKNAVLLLLELICLYRRTTITSFLSCLQQEGIINTLHVLLVYLQGSPPEQKPLVAVLLLHFDLLVEPRKYSIYREEAVDAITVALNSSLTDEKIQKQICRALYTLGGQFSTAGEPLIEAWIMKQAEFQNNTDTISNKHNDKIIEIDEMTSEEENHARAEWLNNLALILLGNGKRSFLETISKCLCSQSLVLQETCLVTVAWMSRSLSSMSDTEFQLSAFSSLIPRITLCLESEQAKHRVLACMTLLNFSAISECRVMLCSFAEQIMIPLGKLVDTTWMAKQLLTAISSVSE